MNITHFIFFGVISSTHSINRFIICQYYIYYDNVRANILAFATMFARIHTHNHLELFSGAAIT